MSKPKLSLAPSGLPAGDLVKHGQHQQQEDGEGQRERVGLRPMTDSPPAMIRMRRTAAVTRALNQVSISGL